jgi:subtilisin-like proprotein convertase family protein
MCKFYTLLSIVALTLCSLAANAQKRLAKTWADETEPITMLQRVIQPTKARNVQINLTAMRQELAYANGSTYTAAGKGAMPIFEMPMPNGGSETFRIWETSCMEPALAAAYPMIKTYGGQSIEHPEVSITMDVSPWGFHAVAHFTDETVYLDPFAHLDTDHYIVYNKSDFKTKKQRACYTNDEEDANAPAGVPTERTIQNGNINLLTSPLAPTGPTLRTYRLALAGTAEYSLFHSPAPVQSKAQVLAAMVTSVNRVNTVYERDVAIHFNLIARNDTLIYFDAAADGYTNTSGSTMLNENQAKLNAIIGTANYDMGHVFSTASGGVAQLGCICGTSKARGTTGIDAPVGDPFDIDYVVHEMGHQFGCQHTFNGNQGSCGGTNRTATSAYEPGSGITIMAYAGICGTDDIDQHSIDIFNTHSFDQATVFAAGGGNSCAAITQSGNNTPIVSVGTGTFAIPKSTPFALTATGSDPDGEAVTFCWEEYDLGGACAPNAAVGTSPTFKSYYPTTSPTRYFPQLSNILAGTTDIGNVLPSYGRTMNFRCTVRDNHPGCGGSTYALRSMTVDAASGPFVVTVPNTTGIVWPVGTTQDITWNVANSNVAPVNCANVRITLSTDGGLTYPTVIVASTPNNGSYSWASVINVTSTTCRVKVEAADNVFFDINDQNFTIMTVAPDYTVNSTDTLKTACAPSSAAFVINSQAISGFSTPINYTITGIPIGSTPVWTGNPATPGSPATLTVNVGAGVAAGTYSINVRGNAGGVIHNKIVKLVVAATAPPAVTALNTPSANATVVMPTNTGFAWTAVATATSYIVEVANDAAFNDIVTTKTSTTTSATISLPLSMGTDYFWRVKSVNVCGTTTSVGQTFKTGYSACLFAASSAAVSIPIATAGTVTSTINVPDSYLVQDLNITNLTITHTYINDLSFRVTGPTGASATLMPRICASENNFSNLTFDDASTVLYNAAGCPPTAGSVLKPQQPLSVFNGTQVNGAWKLAVTDASAGDGGSITRWTVQFCVLSATPIATEDIQGNSNRIAIYPNPTSDILNIQLEETIKNPVLNIFNLQGQLIQTQIGNVNNTINTEMWAAGMYILQVKTAEGILSKKFIVQK